MTLNYVRCAPVLLFCAAVFSAAPISAGQHPTPVTAVVMPDGLYSKLAVRETGREAAAILKQSGVALRWQVGVPPQAVNGTLVVVKLVGRCDMDGSACFS